MASALLLFLKEKQQKNFVRNFVSPRIPKPSPSGEGAPVRTLGRMRGR